jgi:hypothetical protein
MQVGDVVTLSADGAKAAGYPGEQARIVSMNADGTSATVEILTGRKAGKWTGVHLKDLTVVE